MLTMNLTIFVCLLLSIPVVYYVLVKPLFVDATQPYDSEDSDISDFDNSLSLLESISELETDYKMGKLSQEDFESLSLEYKRSYLEEKK